MPGEAAPWVSLGLAILSTLALHFIGVSNDAFISIVAFLIAWLGSMGTWEAIKNIFMRRRVTPTTTTP